MDVSREVSFAKVIYVDGCKDRRGIDRSNAYVVRTGVLEHANKCSDQSAKKAVDKEVFFSLFKRLAKLNISPTSIFRSFELVLRKYFILFLFGLTFGYIGYAGYRVGSNYINKHQSDTEARVGVVGGLESSSTAGISGASKPLQSEKIIRDCATCPALMIIPSGTFVMGSPPHEEGRFIDEGPQRKVRVNSFLLGVYEVTQSEWISIMGDNPSYFKKCGGNCPVESVSYGDVQEYIKRLNILTGQSYRLPTEAEWEYAARAGSATAFPWGENFDPSFANNASVIGVVGRFKSNSFGLHDMHGNVWEFVQDTPSPDYAGASTDGSVPNTGGYSLYRVIRGGSFGSRFGDLRSAYRGSATLTDRYKNTGFRIARDFGVHAGLADKGALPRKTSRDQQLSKGSELAASVPVSHVADPLPSLNYIETLTNLIRSSVINLDPDKKNSIDIILKVEADGLIRSVRINRSSGDAAWDESMVAAVRKVKKLPLDQHGRIPSVLVNEGLIVTLGN